jgi:uncharacterized repeat protein (TIGR02543 family)
MKKIRGLWLVFLAVILSLSLLPADAFATAGNGEAPEAATVAPDVIYEGDEVTITLGAVVARPGGSTIDDEITFFYEHDIPGLSHIRSITPAGQAGINRVIKFTIPPNTKPGTYTLENPQASYERIVEEGRPTEKTTVSYPDSPATPATIPITVTKRTHVMQTYEFLLVDTSSSAEFYACDGFNADGSDIPGERLQATDAGIQYKRADKQYHVYELRMPSDTTISFRGKDGNGVSLGGMTVDLPNDDYVQFMLVEYDFLITNRDEDGNSFEHDDLDFSITYGDDRTVTLGDEYLGSDYYYTGNPGYRSLLYAAERDMAYNVKVNVVSTKEGDLFWVKNLDSEYYVSPAHTNHIHIRLPRNPLFDVTAPAEATVQVHYAKNINHCNEEMEVKEEIENPDGTVTYVFDSNDIDAPLYAGTVSYRATLPGGMMRAGHRTSNHTVVTFPDGPGDPQTRRTYDKESGAQADRFGEDNILLNINERNALRLGVGDEFEVIAHRTWQLVNNPVANASIDPVFHYEVIEGDSVEITPGRKTQFATIKAVQPGLSIVEVTYEAAYIEGHGIYNAIDPDRKGRIIVDVVDEDAPSGYVNLNLGSWDSEFDTVYFFENPGAGIYTGEFNFRPTASGGREVSVEARGAGEEFSEVPQNEDGSFTVPVCNGNNDVLVESSGERVYFLLRGQKTKLNVENLSHPDQEPGPYDRVRFTFDNMNTPVAKMGGVYNGSSQIQYIDDDTSATVIGENSQYTFSHSHGVTVTLNKDGGVSLRDGKIRYSTGGLAFGDHRNIGPDGMGMASAGGGVRHGCIMPDIMFAGFGEGSGEPENTDPIDVRVSFQKDAGEFELARRPLAVAAGLASEYGHEAAEKFAPGRVTALDALVAAHIAKYGEDAGDISEKLNVLDGVVTMAFGQALPDPSDFIYFINGAAPGGGGSTPGDALIEPGDKIEFFSLQSGLGGSADPGDPLDPEDDPAAAQDTAKFAWFEAGGDSGDKTGAVTLTEGESLPLTIKGYPASAALSGAAVQAAQTSPISGASIVLMDRDLDSGEAAFKGAPLATTDANGRAELRFDEAGVYIISAIGRSGAAPLLSPWCVVTVFEKDEPGDGTPKTVYFSVEKFAIGRGYVKTPVAVAVKPGENVANVVDKVLGADGYKKLGSIGSGFYLQSVRDKDASPNDLYIPEYIARRIRAAGQSVTVRGLTGWLSQMDYSPESGWIYVVNDRMAPVGMSDYTYEKLRDGDVIRVQFSLHGYGADVSGGEDGYKDLPSRDALIRACAGINIAPHRDELLAPGSQLKAAYEYALSVMSDLEVSSEKTLAAALVNLKKALDNEYFPPPPGSGTGVIGGDAETGDDSGGDDKNNEDAPDYLPSSDNEDNVVPSPAQQTKPGSAFAVMFVPAGGRIAGEKSSLTVRNGLKYGPLPTASRKGYTFAGWFTKARGGVRILPSTTVTLSADQTLYAQWKAKKYKIKFNVNKGKALKKSKRAKKVTYDGKFGKLPKPKRDGYTFKGWYTKKVGGKKIIAKTRVRVAKTTTLYARWKKSKNR